MFINFFHGNTLLKKIMARFDASLFEYFNHNLFSQLSCMQISIVLYY